LDLYVILSLFVFLSFSIDLFGADFLSEKHLSGASSPVDDVCRCKILISRAEYAVRMERTWMHSVAWNSTRCDPIDSVWDSAILLQFGSGFTWFYSGHIFHRWMIPNWTENHDLPLSWHEDLQL